MSALQRTLLVLPLAVLGFGARAQEPAQNAAEIAFWNSVKDSKNPAELQAYISAFPNGLFAQLARLRLEGARLPAGAIVGKPGDGFKIAMATLDGGRIGIASQALGIARAGLEKATAYSKERKAFGKPIFSFQNTRFKLAECQALLMASRALVDAAMVSHLEGKLGVERAALIKYWITDNQCKVIDECLQLFGGYGYMKEYVIARLWADARVQRIYGGTNEIMKELASRFL